MVFKFIEYGFVQSHLGLNVQNTNKYLTAWPALAQPLSSYAWVITAKLYMTTLYIETDNITVYYKKGWIIEYVSLCHKSWSIYEICSLGL